MPWRSYKTVLKASVFCNIFFISFLVTFAVTLANHVNHHPQPPRGLNILIDLNHLELIIYQDSRLQKTFPVAIGKTRTPWPVGSWEIVAKEKWGEGFGSHWLGLNVPFGVYGIHGTNKPGSIGNLISGGCIRMFNRDIAEVYQITQIGTPVQIIGDPFRDRRILLRGLTGSDVLFLQKRLRQLGFFAGNPNGIFDDATEKAVLEFQKLNRIPMTGQVRSVERKRLKLISGE